MDALTENFDLILKGFAETLKLLLSSGLLALALGTLIGIARVSPVPILRGAAIAYVTIFRNTPLLVLILLTIYGLPQLGIDFGFFWNITLAMGVYTASFVTEAIRSGINGIPLGQAEAARSIGMPFGMTMTQVLLPQAFRLVVPPLASVFIALTKNTSVAGGFFVVELIASSRKIINIRGDETVAILLAVAVFYLIITIPLGQYAGYLERKVAVLR